MNTQFARVKGGSGDTSPPSPVRRIRLTETAAIQACPRCRRHTLIAAPYGIPARCDPENLTLNGELAAKLQSRLTFDVHVYGLPRRMHFEYRHLDRIKAQRRHPVVAEHRCGGELILLTEKFTDEVTDIVLPYSRPQTDEPPF